MTTIRGRKFESFAVVNDKSYQRFLKAEAAVLSADGEAARLAAIFRASKLVGSLLECPDCGRFLLSMPGGTSEALYLREDKPGKSRLNAKSDLRKPSVRDTF